MAHNNELNAFSTRIALAALAGGATVTLPALWFKRGSRLKQLSLLSAANIAADPANYITVQLQDLAGNVLATLSTRAIATGDGAGPAVLLTPLSSNLGKDIDLSLAIGLTTKLVVSSTGTAAVGVNSAVQIDWHNR